jgi:peptide/nickel transport system permease protein
VAYARAARGEALILKREPYVLAARSLGATNLRIISRHILPQLLPTALVLATLGISEAVLLEAGLSFLGLGIQPPDPSLGALLSEGREYIFRAPWLAIFPGFVIFLVVFGINSFGDGLRTLLDKQDS